MHIQIRLFNGDHNAIGLQALDRLGAERIQVFWKQLLKAENVKLVVDANLNILRRFRLLYRILLISLL